MRMIALVLASVVAGCASPPAPVEVVEAPKRVVVAKKPVAKKVVVVAAKPVVKRPAFVVPPTAGGGSGW